MAEKLLMVIGVAEDMTGRSFATDFTTETLPPAVKATMLLILGTLYDNESDNIVVRFRNSRSPLKNSCFLGG